jgi:hypothetical protein
VIAEELQLTPQDFLDGSFDDGLSHFDSQGFDRIKVDLQPWPFIAKGTAGDNLTPASGHILECSLIVGLRPGERHGEFILELGEREKLGKRA